MKIKQRKQSSTIFWLFLYESHTSDDFPLSSQNFHYIFILNIKRNVGVGFFFSLLIIDWSTFLRFIVQKDTCYRLGLIRERLVLKTKEFSLLK